MQLPKLNTIFSKKGFITALSWVSAQLLVIIFISVFLIGALVTTQGGRNWLVNHGISWLKESEILANQGLTIDLQGFNSPETNRYHFNQLEVTKLGQTWINIQQFNLEFEIKPLWMGKININNLTMAEMTYTQLPSQENPEEELPPEEEPTSLSDIKLPKVRLDNLNIEKLKLNGVLPESLHNPNFHDDSIAYRVTGEGNLYQGSFSSKPPLDVALKAAPLSEALPSLDISIIGDDLFDNELLLTVSEKPNGWLGYWLKLPENKDLTAQLDSNVSLEQDQLHLNIQQLLVPVVTESIGLAGEITYVPNVNQTDASDGAETWAVRSGDLVLSVAQSKHPVTFDIALPAIAANAKIQELPLDIFSAWVPQLTEGVIDGEISLSETIDNPQFSALIDSSAVYANETLTVMGKAHGSKQTVNVEDLQLAFKNAKASAKGSINIDQGDNDFKFNVSNLSSDTLAPLNIGIPDELHFLFPKISGELTGTMDQPKATLDINGGGNYQDLEFTAQSKARVNGDEITLTSLLLELPDGFAKASGNLNYKTLNADMKADIKDIPLDIASAVGVNLPAGLTGIVNGAIKTKGDLTNPHADAQLTIDGNLSDQPYYLNVNGGSTDGGVDLEALRLSVNDRELISATGSYRNEELAANLTVDALDTQLLSDIGVELPAGTVNSMLTITGTVEKPNIDGEFTYALQQVGYDKNGEQKPFDIVIKTEAKTENGQLALITNLTRSDTPPGKLNLSLPLYDYIDTYLNSPPASSAETPLNFDLQMNLDLQSIGFLIDPDVNQITGMLTADLKASGVLADPSLDGDLNLAKASYFNSLLGTQIEKFNCSFLAKHQTFQLNTCKGTDGDDGKIELNGEITLPKEQSYGAIDIALKTKKAELVKRVDINSHATGEIDIKGDFKELFASGEIEITPLNAMIDVNMGASIPEIEVTEITKESEPESEVEPLFPTPTVNLDLTIRASQQAYLRGRGLEAELSGEIFLTGTADDPQYTGEFNTLRGELEVFGKKFNLEQGQASFINNSIAVAVRAVYEKDSNQIFAEVSGQDEDFTIEFSSVPTMPQDEILSYIIFGESAADIEPIKAVQLAMAIQKLQGGSSSFDAIGTARDLLGVDTITFDSQSEDENGNGGLNIGVGKYLNDRTYLELERTANPSQPWKGTIEIELTPRIHLQSTTGGTSGIDSAEVIWEKDY